jgi:hypothetical protein
MKIAGVGYARIDGFGRIMMPKESRSGRRSFHPTSRAFRVATADYRAPLTVRLFLIRAHRVTGPSRGRTSATGSPPFKNQQRTATQLRFKPMY